MYNMGHLFAMVFELPAFYNMTLINHHPDTAPVAAIKVLYLDLFQASLSVSNATLHQCSFMRIV